MRSSFTMQSRRVNFESIATERETELPEERHTHPHQIVVVEKPWGRFKEFTHNEPSTVKIVEVNPGEALSLQSHHHRDELWVFLDDGAEVQLDDETIHPRAWQEVIIARNSKHRLTSRGGCVRVLEVAFGEFDEDDIIRYEDRYGRGT